MTGMPTTHVDAFCAKCGARLAPGFSGLRCPRITSCGRGGLLEGYGVEIVRLDASAYAHGPASAHA